MTNNNAKGIGGWLLFFIILPLTISSIAWILHSVQLVALGLGAIGTCIGVLGVCVGILGIASAIFLTRTNPLGLTLSKVFLISCLVVKGPQVIAGFTNTVDLVRTTLFAIVWMSYLEQSVRVRNTYKSEEVQ